jgi:hypothetical protein
MHNWPKFAVEQINTNLWRFCAPYLVIHLFKAPGSKFRGHPWCRPNQPGQTLITCHLKNAFKFLTFWPAFAKTEYHSRMKIPWGICSHHTGQNIALTPKMHN